MKTRNFKAGRLVVVGILMILGLIYIISPVDIVTDYIPVAGWIDDVVVMLGDAALNAVILIVSQMWLKKKESLTARTTM